MTAIGHNQPSIDSIVEENLLRGIYLAQLNCITRAVQDPRLSSRHLQVLAQIIERTNAKTGFAYPGRARLAADIVYYINGEPKHYTESSVATAISDLIEFGYIMAERRGVDGKGRALSHYVTKVPAKEDLEAQITAWCLKMRNQPRRKFPAPQPSDVDINITVRTKTDGDTRVSIRKPDEDTRVNVNDGIAVRNRPDVDTGIGSDVDTGIPTVTGDDLTGRSMPAFALEAEADKGAKAQADKRKKGTRLSDDWKLPHEWRRKTQTKHGLSDKQIDRQADRFYNYWVAKPGKDGVKLRWDLTWDNWIVSAIDRGLKPEGANSNNSADPDRKIMGEEAYARYQVLKREREAGHA